MSDAAVAAGLSALLAEGDRRLIAGDEAGAEALYRQALPLTQFFTRAPVVSRLGLIGKPRAASLLRVLTILEQEFPGNDPFVSLGMAVWLKTNGMVYNDRLLEVMAKHDALSPIPNWHWNLQTVIWAVRQARPVEGEFLELGVFKGHTTAVVAEYVNFHGWEKSWSLYDTFDGIPEDQLNEGWTESNRIYKGTFSFEEVSARFARYPNIKVFKGRVPEVLHQGCPEKIAFIHMDLNSAVAEVAALELLFDRLSPGGLIVFDDYCWRASVRQYNAEKAWFENRGLRVLELPTGQGVFIKQV